MNQEDNTRAYACLRSCCMQRVSAHLQDLMQARERRREDCRVMWRLMLTEYKKKKLPEA